MKTFKYTWLILLAFTFVLNAQNSVIKNLQNKFYSINTLTSDFSQSSRMVEGGKSNSIKGKLYYQKNDKYRIELKNQELISDGSTFWNYNKRTNKVIINDLKNEKSAFSLKNIIVDYPAKSNVESLTAETLDGEKCNVVRLTARKPGENFNSIKIWSDSNNLIRKIELRDNGGLINTFEFSRLKINQDIPTNKFSFEPPKGSEIVDLR